MSPDEILEVEKDIVATLKNIYDPEIPVNIYDLGLIYEIDYTPDGVATIRMTLTAPNCPMADMLVEDVNIQVGKVKGEIGERHPHVRPRVGQEHDVRRGPAGTQPVLI